MSYNKKDRFYDYTKIKADIENNNIGNLYIFHGDEHYLRDRYIEQLRNHVCPDGTGSFNYRRFEGANITLHDLDDAVDTLPVFAERTFIEIHDFSLLPKGSSDEDENNDSSLENDESDNKTNERRLDINHDSLLINILSNLPDYVCLLFIYNTITFKPDGRKKAHKQIINLAQVIEFTVQNQSELFKWITGHYKRIGKQIGKPEAEHLVHITGGYMATLKNEIEKTAAFSKTDYITRADIDAVVMPILDAVIYQLTDAIIKRDFYNSMKILDELLRMREAPQKLIYSISLKMRQLLAAKVCIENNLSKSHLMDLCGIRFDFQANMLMNTARKTTPEVCRSAVIDCTYAAYDLNTASDSEARLIELVAKLAS